MSKVVLNYEAQMIPDAKHYSKEKLEFDYLTRKEFKKLEDSNVVGRIVLSKFTNDDNASTLVVKSNDCTYRFALVNVNKSLKYFVLGYIKVGTNTYVEVTKSLTFLILSLLLILFIGLAVAYFTSNDVSLGPDIADGSDWDGNFPLNGDTEEPFVTPDSIIIPGYSDIYISSDKPNVQLINPDNNTVNMVYEILYNDKVIYETDGAITVGKVVNANLFDIFNGKEGKYDLVFRISTYDVDTNIMCNGATQSVVLTIK